MLVSCFSTVWLKVSRATSRSASNDTLSGRNTFPSIVPSSGGGPAPFGPGPTGPTAPVGVLVVLAAGAEPSGFLSWQPTARTSDRSRSPRECMTVSEGHDDG